MASNAMASRLEEGESPSNTPTTNTDSPSGQLTTGTNRNPTNTAHFFACLNDIYIATLRLLQSASRLSNKRAAAEGRRQRRMKQTSIRRLQDYPNGFPRLSCFLDSDDSFVVYRRFGTVFSRLLLSKQDEMSRMEEILGAMDKMDESDGNARYLMSHALDAGRQSIPPAWPEPRSRLLEKLERKAVEYAELLLKAKQLKALEGPSHRDYKSVLHFMENDGGPLFEEESRFIYNREDLVTLRPNKEDTRLDSMFERFLQKFRCGLFLFFFQSKEIKQKTDDMDIHYYDRDRIRKFTTFLLTILILVLLIVPIWLLYRFSVAGTIATSPETICVLLVFTLIFSVALSAFTKAKRHEIVAASAG